MDGGAEGAGKVFTLYLPLHSPPTPFGPLQTSPKRLSLETVKTTNVPVNRTRQNKERTFDGRDVTARTTERLFCDFITDLCWNPSLVTGCAVRHYLWFSYVYPRKCFPSIHYSSQSHSTSCKHA
jgi:hypothetical protein